MNLLILESHTGLTTATEAGLAEIWELDCTAAEDEETVLEDNIEPYEVPENIVDVDAKIEVLDTGTKVEDSYDDEEARSPEDKEGLGVINGERFEDVEVCVMEELES